LLHLRGEGHGQRRRTFTSQTFQVTVTNNGPVLDFISSPSVSHTQGPIVVNLSASDADSDPLTYSALILGNPPVTMTQAAIKSP